MERNAILLKPGAIMCFMAYTTPDRTQVMPVLGDIWVDRTTALSDRYALGTTHVIASRRGLKKTSTYVVAMFPLIRWVPDPHRENAKVLHITVYCARAEEFSLFKSVDEMTPNEIRAAMRQLSLN